MNWVGRLILCFIVCSFLYLYEVLFNFTGVYNASKIEVGKCYYVDNYVTDDFRENPYSSSLPAPEYLAAICILSEKEGWFEYDYFEFRVDKQEWSHWYVSEHKWYKYPFTDVVVELSGDHLLYSRSFR